MFTISIVITRIIILICVIQPLTQAIKFQISSIRVSISIVVLVLVLMFVLMLLLV